MVHVKKILLLSLFAISLQSILLMSLVLTIASAPYAISSPKIETPFWQNKPELQKKLEDERALLVSANAGDDPEYRTGMPQNLKQILRVSGVGIVNTPIAFATKEVLNFENLPKIDDRFIESKFNKSKNELYLHCATFGFHAMMTLRMNLSEGPGFQRISWESIEGSFKGMTGHIELRDHQRQKTEISMTARYASAKLPLPEILMGFGLEVVTQRVAGVMRSYLESEYKREQLKINQYGPDQSQRDQNKPISN